MQFLLGVFCFVCLNIEIVAYVFLFWLVACMFSFCYLFLLFFNSGVIGSFLSLCSSFISSLCSYFVFFFDLFLVVVARVHWR